MIESAVNDYASDGMFAREEADFLTEVLWVTGEKRCERKGR